MKILFASILVVAMATPALAARKVNGAPAPGALKSSDTVYYKSDSCTRANPAKPFKVVTSTNGRRIEIGCFSEADARRK